MALVDWSDAQKQAFVQMQFDAQTRHYAEHFGNANFDIIELDGQPVGRLYVDARADDIRIIDIAILPQFQRRGLGSHFLREILAQGQASDCSVSIHVERNNPALELYRRLGFERVHDEGIYYLMTWRPTADQENTAS